MALKADIASSHAGTSGLISGEIAYITTRYPSISHTFILHELEALRDRGIDVHPVSIREVDGEHLLSEGNRRAFRMTHTIRPPRWRQVLGAHAQAFTRAPRAYLGTLRYSLRMARPGAKGRLWQILYFAEAMTLWSHCATRGARHVHAHHGSPPADVALLAARFGARAGRGPGTWSMTLHGPTEFSNTRWFRLPQKIRDADGIICISDFARSQVMALVEQEHWAKLEVVHCGLPPRENEHPREDAERRPRILCVGRLVAEKGQAVLIEAHASLRHSGHDVELVLVGAGPELPALKRLATKLGFSDDVTFAGAVGQDDIRRHYRQATVFCSSSFNEGLPYVLMEAMAAGRPVVATAIAGVRELVHDGDTGLIVSPGRVDELTRAIARLLEDPRLRAELGAAGCRYVAREFDARRSAAKLEGFFHRMLNLPAHNAGEGNLELAEPPGEGQHLEAEKPARGGAVPMLR